jgi:hypothetical protein
VQTNLRARLGLTARQGQDIRVLAVRAQGQRCLLLLIAWIGSTIAFEKIDRLVRVDSVEKLFKTWSTRFYRGS